MAERFFTVGDIEALYILRVQVATTPFIDLGLKMGLRGAAREKAAAWVEEQMAIRTIRLDSGALVTHAIVTGVLDRPARHASISFEGAPPGLEPARAVAELLGFDLTLEPPNCITAVRPTPGHGVAFHIMQRLPGDRL